MNWLRICNISKRLAHYSNTRGFPALICWQSMPHSCNKGYLDIPLYRQLHSLGFGGISSHEIFHYEETRVCNMGIFREVSTEAVATQKTSDGLPDDLYRRISRLRDPKRSAVDELERWVMEGRKVNKQVLIGIAKKLRKYFRHKHALEGPIP